MKKNSKILVFAKRRQNQKKSIISWNFWKSSKVSLHFGHLFVEWTLLKCQANLIKVLKTLVLQNLDTPPHFPWLFNFLNWWDDNIEGQLKIVTLLGVTPSKYQWQQRQGQHQQSARLHHSRPLTTRQQQGQRRAHPHWGTAGRAAQWTNPWTSGSYFILSSANFLLYRYSLWDVVQLYNVQSIRDKPVFYSLPSVLKWFTPYVL